MQGTLFRYTKKLVPEVNKMKRIIQDYSKRDIEEMSTMSIYMLMDDRGADVFGLYGASKSELLREYERQIGFGA